MSQITIEKFNDILHKELASAAETGLYLREIDAGRAELVLPYSKKSLRPGGTIAGPLMMMLADVCMFAVVLSLLGEVKLAVTTNLNINFLQKPSNQDLVAKGAILKMGKRLAVVEVSIYSEAAMVAHASGTYSIPPST